MGVVGPRRARGDAQAVGIEDRALARDHEVEVRILGHHLGDVAVVVHDDVDIAGQEQVLAVVVMEDFDIGLLADVHLRHLVDTGRGMWRTEWPRYLAPSAIMSSASEK